jgi:predicted branched-subunit amino acid permease
MSGGADAVIRQIRSRAPLPVIWAVLSVASVVCLRLIDPDTEAFEYAQNPIFVGVAFLASRAVPRRHAVWLSALIAASVSLAVTLSWKAIS